MSCVHYLTLILLRITTPLNYRPNNIYIPFGTLSFGIFHLFILLFFGKSEVTFKSECLIREFVRVYMKWR